MILNLPVTIVLILTAYMICAIIVGAVCYYFLDDEDVAIFLGFLWFIAILSYLVYTIGKVVILPFKAVFNIKKKKKGYNNK